MHKPAVANTPLREPDPLEVLGPAIRMLPFESRAIFQGGADARSAAASLWSPGFSAEPCRARGDGTRSSLWLGPDEFLLMASDVSPADLLQTGLRDVPCSVVDVSHRQVGIELSGPTARFLLNGGCPLDLDPGAFPIGMCTRTVFAKAEIVLWRQAAEVFRIEVWRSFADYTIRMLAEISRA